jgi:hypothetical protein
MTEKLLALRERLVTAQRKLLMDAAETNLLPADSALRKISDLENAIAAVEVLISEHDGAGSGGHQKGKRG